MNARMKNEVKDLSDLCLENNYYFRKKVYLNEKKIYYCSIHAEKCKYFDKENNIAIFTNCGTAKKYNLCKSVNKK